MHINRNKLKSVASKTVDITVDATEVIIENIPIVVTKAIQRTGPYIQKGVKCVAKTTMNALYKIAFK